ncbi:sortase domain-containing protein [Actinomadura rupiterrae]|uniref:sortase domain-containing protein n=1 Tax=Actinomadura rupiterrae TaxID=559627 RepID=UPI0020A2ACAA|nr:class F sortase [Actinomadura rupiterrae]MCP2343308.1 sortase (surface protein transpeptidase) [Actinomadura rupiterrae]
MPRPCPGRRRQSARCVLRPSPGASAFPRPRGRHERASFALPQGRADVPAPLRTALDHAVPTRLLIPKIALSAPLGRVLPGTVQALLPDAPDRARWLASGPSPGEPGAALVLGRLDTASGPGVFAHLGELSPGDIIGVARSDGTVAVFRMTRAEQVPKRRFSESRVLVAGTVPELRLITCAGRYDRARGAYDDNLIVYATFAAAYRAADLASMPRG